MNTAFASSETVSFSQRPPLLIRIHSNIFTFLPLLVEEDLNWNFTDLLSKCASIGMLISLVEQKLISVVEHALTESSLVNTSESEVRKRKECADYKG